MEELEKIEQEIKEALETAKSKEALEKIRIAYLGRSGKLTAILRSLKDFSVEERRKTGAAANKLRTEIEKVLDEKEKKIIGKEGGKGEDITLPVLPKDKAYFGSLHPLTIVGRDIKKIFTSMNFSVAEGPEAETEYYNFDALNIPANHPAREMWDTFWVKSQTDAKDGKNLLMRTHTSPVQIRFMEKHKPPFAIIAPGRVFRYEATDSSHEINFHQVEGLAVDKKISLANLKFVVEEFFSRFFEEKLSFRFRPSYFPFVEPGVEVDIKLPGEEKWLEVMGAGMVHKRVLEGVRIDSEKWQGFAFGMGVERLAMIKYGIPDIRLFYSGDLRFIKQF